MTDEPIVDGAVLERLLRIGGQDFLLEMIDLFLDNAPQRIATARTALSEGDHAVVYRAAHSLKSTAGNLGARRLQAASARVEERAAAGDADPLPELIDAMSRCYDDVRERLEAERRHRQGDGA